MKNRLKKENRYQSNEKIIVEPHNTIWSRTFDEEAEKIKKALGDNCIEIHHIGSTSIPNLAAKPIIDILPVVKDIMKVDVCNKQMEELGYEARGELGMLFRRFFRKRGFNVHVFEEDSPEIERHLLFRAYLSENPDARNEYGALKISLAEKWVTDKFEYTIGKNDFITSLIKKSGFEGMVIVHALHRSEWEEYHRIREEQIFIPIGVKYDRNHPTISDLNHVHLVMYKSSVIVGMAHIEFRSNSCCILRGIAIDKQLQRQGIGTSLLQLLEKWLRQKNIKVLYLHTDKNKIEFYTRLGYTRMDFEDNDALMIKNRIELGKILENK